MTWQIPDYAGGHQQITHIDIGALKWLETKKCHTLLDVGCGTGGQVLEAINRGWAAFGIEVDPAVLGAPNVAIIDLADQPVLFHHPFDVVWSVEVAEHIPERFESKYIATLAFNCGKYLILTASQIPMPLHFNCKPREHWIKTLEQEGLVYDEELYRELLEHSTMEREFLKETGMVFRRK